MNNRTKLSYLLTFFLSLFIASIVSFIGFSLGLGNKTLFQNTIAKSNYYRTLGANLEFKTKELLDDYDLPKSFGVSLWPEEEVYRDMNGYVNEVLFEGRNQKDIPNFVTRIAEKIRTRMDEYYVSETPCDKEEWERVKEQIARITISDYHNSIRLPLLETYPQFYQSLNKYCVIVFVVGGILSAIVCVLLFFMYRHKYKSLRYICYAVFSGTTITIVSNFVLQNQMKIQNEYLADVSYTNLCNEVVKAGFLEANIGAYMGLFVGIILLGTILWMKEKSAK